MSFDLYFCRENNSTPSVLELKEYFSSAPYFEVTDVAADGVEFWYHNKATGVYCGFSYSPLDANELEGCGSSGLIFNLNYVRPSFFAYEAMPLVEAFCNRFGLLVEDPQEETVQSGEAERLIASWRKHNALATTQLIKQEKNLETHYLPESRATEWWRYMTLQQGIDEAVTEDIFVPTLMILKNPAQQLFTMLVWPKGIAQFFPPCDFVYVQRERKRLFGTKEESGLVPYQSVLETIGPLLNDYEVRGLNIRYLNPPNSTKVASMLQSLNLEPVDLSQHTQVASDGFHDVPLKGEGL